MGAYVVVPGGGHAWLLPGGVVVGGHAWLLPGDVYGCSRGACMVALGGHAWLLGGHVWLLWGACMVALGEHAWFFGGCMVFSGGHAWFFGEGGVCVFFDEIRSISGQYASYWNAFLFFYVFHMFFNLSHFRIRFCFM